MSVSHILDTSNTQLQWKKLSVYSVASDSVTTNTLNTGAITSTGAISGSNITPYTYYCQVTNLGTFATAFGSIPCTVERISQGYYRLTFDATLPRFPFSVQVSAYQANGTYRTCEHAFITFVNQAKIEWKLKDDAGAVIDAYSFLSIVA